MNIWNEKGAFYHNYTPPPTCNKLGEGGGGGVTGIKLSVHPSVDRMVPRLLVLAFLPRVTISCIWSTYCIWVKRAKVKHTWHRSIDIVSGLKNYPFCLESLDHTWGSSYIWFPGSRALSFLPRVTISYIYITHETKMFFIEFWVKRSKVKCTGHQSSNMISRLFSIILST